MSDSGAKGSELGICLRSTPSSPLACFVPSCDFVNPNLDRVKDHIEAVHHTKGAIRFEISFFEQTDADLLASTAVPSAPNTDEDDSMDTDDPANSEELSGMATDEDGYAPGVDESGGLEGEDEEEVSDAPANERLFFMRGRLPQDQTRIRPTPYTRSTSNSRGRQHTRRTSESSNMGFGQLRIQTTSSRAHSPAMVIPSPLGQVAYSRPNSKSSTDDDESPDHMDIDVELGFVDNAAILKMASLKMVSLSHLLQMPTPLLVICTHCEIALVPQSAIRHSKIEHHIVLSKDQKRSIEKVLGAPGVIRTPATTIPPKPPCAPIEGLELRTGVSCNLCNHCCIADSSIWTHMREKHPRAGGPAKSNVSKATLQVFSPQNKKYFAVVPVLSGMDEGNLFTTYLRQHVPQIEALQLITPPLDHLEIPPLLVVTGWYTHLAPYMGDRTKVRLLRELTQVPTSTKGVAWMGERLRKTINAYVKDVTQKGNDADLELRMVLMECPRLGLRSPLSRPMAAHHVFATGSHRKGSFGSPFRRKRQRPMLVSFTSGPMRSCSHSKAMLRLTYFH